MEADFFDYNWDSENSKIYRNLFKHLIVIDSHLHIGKDKDGIVSTPEGVIKKMDEANISQSIIFPFNEMMIGKNFHSPNNRILKAFKKYPDRFIPFFRLDPLNNWKREFNLRVKQGFIGIKLHPLSQKFKLLDPRVMEIYKEAEKAGLMIILHTGTGMTSIGKNIKKISDKFPKLKIILGHAAYLDLWESIELLRNNQNVFFELSTMKVFDLYKLFKSLPPERIIFGSDYPYHEMKITLETVLDTALVCGRTPKMIKGILGENILKWLKPYEAKNKGLEKGEYNKLIDLSSILKTSRFKVIKTLAKGKFSDIIDLPRRPVTLLNNKMKLLLNLLSYSNKARENEIKIQYLRIYSLANRGEVFLIQKSFGRAYRRFTLMVKITKSPIAKKEMQYMETIRDVASSIISNKKWLKNKMRAGFKLNQTKIKAQINLIKSICILRILKS